VERTEKEWPELTAALTACRQEEPRSLDRLVELLYPELRRIARWQLRRLRPGQTLDTTSLVNESYVKLVGSDDFVDRSHFLAASARAMRHILVNAARSRAAQKRGSGDSPEVLDEDQVGRDPTPIGEILDVAAALDGLRELDERLCQVVECRFFAGMTEDETATALEMSSRTVRRDWLRARAWLKRELGRAPGAEASTDDD